MKDVSFGKHRYKLRQKFFILRADFERKLGRQSGAKAKGKSIAALSLKKKYKTDENVEKSFPSGYPHEVQSGNC